MLVNCGDIMANETEMTLYETLFILRTEQAPKVKEFLERYKKIIEDRQGAVTHIEEWGNRELAYPINKQSRGNYSLIRYRAPAGTVEELERTMKLSEEVIRFMTVCVDEDADVPSPHAPKQILQAPTPSLKPEPSAAQRTESSAGKTPESSKGEAGT